MAHDHSEPATKQTALQRRRDEVAAATEAAILEAHADALRPLSIQERLQQHRIWLKEARNENTSRTYSSALKQFRLWANTVENIRRTDEDQVDYDRPSQLDVALYVQYVVQVKQGSRAVVNGALAAISDHIRYERTVDYDPCNSSLVQQTRESLRTTTRMPTPKRELVWRDIQRLINTIQSADDVNRWIRRRDALMILMAYSALLRGSEIVRMNVEDVSISEVPRTASRITQLSRTVLKAYVGPLSKNDAERKGHTRLIEKRGGEAEDSLTCVVNHTRAWLHDASMSQQWPGGPPPMSDPDEMIYPEDRRALFPTKAGGRMHEDTPRGRLSTWLTRAGYTNVSEYGFHSLRAGGATDASRAGATERDIQRHGNWKSNIVQTYIRSNDDDRLRVSQALNTQSENHNAIVKSESRTYDLRTSNPPTASSTDTVSRTKVQHDHTRQQEASASTPVPLTPVDRRDDIDADDIEWDTIYPGAFQQGRTIRYHVNYQKDDEPQRAEMTYPNNTKESNVRGIINSWKRKRHKRNDRHPGPLDTHTQLRSEFGP